MSQLTEHGLVCLDESEYAATALAMQVDAQAINAIANAQSTSLNTYNNRPWLLSTSTVATTGAQSTNEFVLGSAFPGLTLSLSPTSGTVVRSGMSSFVTTGAINPAGWYQVGLFASFQATGAVNTFTRRTLCLQWQYFDGGTAVYDQAIETCYESNTGGDGMTVSGCFYADGAHKYFPTALFAHRNSSSTMTVNTGAKMWIVYLGSGVTL